MFSARRVRARSARRPRPDRPSQTTIGFTSALADVGCSVARRPRATRISSEGLPVDRGLASERIPGGAPCGGTSIARRASARSRAARPQSDIAERLGEDATQTEHHARPELWVADDARDQLAATGHHSRRRAATPLRRRDGEREQLACGAIGRRRGRRVPRRTRLRSVLWARAGPAELDRRRGSRARSPRRRPPRVIGREPFRGDRHAVGARASLRLVLGQGRHRLSSLSAESSAGRSRALCARAVAFYGARPVTPTTVSPAYANYVLGRALRRLRLQLRRPPDPLDPARADQGASSASPTRRWASSPGSRSRSSTRVAGIPIARLADRGVRRTVIAIGLALWSAMTAASRARAQLRRSSRSRASASGIGEAALHAARALAARRLLPARSAARPRSGSTRWDPHRHRCSASCSAAGSTSTSAGAPPSSWWACPASRSRCSCASPCASRVRGAADGRVTAAAGRAERARSRATSGRLRALPPPRARRRPALLRRLRLRDLGPAFLVRVHDMSHAPSSARGSGSSGARRAWRDAGSAAARRPASARRDVRWSLWVPAPSRPSARCRSRSPSCCCPTQSRSRSRSRRGHPRRDVARPRLRRHAEPRPPRMRALASASCSSS